MMTSPTTERRLAGVRPAALLGAAALALGLAAPAWAGPGGRAASQTPEAVRDADATTPAGGGAGVSVAIDAKTGEVRPPTQEERRAIDRSLQALSGKSTLAAAPEAVVWPDGTVALQLSDEHLNVFVARVNPDGSITQGCVGSPEEAEAFHAASAALEEQ